MIHRRLTPARRAWLERLREEGPQKHIGKGPAGFACRALGWSEWYVGRNGERLPQSVAQARYPDFASMHQDGWRYLGDVEIITPAGLAALANGALDQ